MPEDACQFFYEGQSCKTVASEAGGLLRVLLVWLGEVPTGSGPQDLL